MCQALLACLPLGVFICTVRSSTAEFPLFTVFQQQHEMGWWNAAGVTLDLVKDLFQSRVIHRFPSSGETSLVKIVSASVFQLGSIKEMLNFQSLPKYCTPMQPLAICPNGKSSPVQIHQIHPSIYLFIESTRPSIHIYYISTSYLYIFM